MTNELQNRLLQALSTVSDVLSSVPDVQWDKVQAIQALINQAEDIASHIEVDYAS